VPELQSAYQIYRLAKAMVLKVLLGGPDVASGLQQLTLMTFLNLLMAHLSPQTDDWQTPAIGLFSRTDWVCRHQKG